MSISARKRPRHGFKTLKKPAKVCLRRSISGDPEMAILIDSDVIIRSERGHFDLDAWLMSFADEEFRIAAITVAELWHGVEHATGAHRAKRRLFLERIFATFEFVHYTPQVAFEHARLWAELESSGQMIGAHDLILAATAIHTGSDVATFNVRPFSVVKGLNVIEPK
jgi:tRNA(fMet)-specific endonuclease VapC